MTFRLKKEIDMNMQHHIILLINLHTNLQHFLSLNSQPSSLTLHAKYVISGFSLDSFISYKHGKRGFTPYLMWKPCGLWITEIFKYSSIHAESWHRTILIPGTQLQSSRGRLMGGYKMITALPKVDKPPSAKTVLCI